MEEMWESHKLLCVSVGILVAALAFTCICRLLEK